MRSAQNQEINSLYNFHFWHTGLLSAGQPDEEELEGLAAKGVRRIINLDRVNSETALRDEAGLVTAMGLTYCHIPVRFEAPAAPEFHRFCAQMTDGEGQSCFVHCQANYISSVFVALYLHFYKSYSYENVMNQVYDIWQPNRVWQIFVSDLLQRHATQINERSSRLLDMVESI